MIRKGDTLYKISRIYRVPLALILRANPYVDVYNLQPGDEICIPLIPQQIKPPMPGMPGNPGNQEHLMIYVVQDGDSMGSVLKRFRLTPEEFLKINRPEHIMLRPGSTVEVPEANMGTGNRPRLPEMEEGLEEEFEEGEYDEEQFGRESMMPMPENPDSSSQMPEE